MGHCCFGSDVNILIVSQKEVQGILSHISNSALAKQEGGLQKQANADTNCHTVSLINSDIF